MANWLFCMCTYIKDFMTMKRRGFIGGISLLLASSCARKEKRKERYDPNECPFCSTQPGTCSYCNGTTKCSFCNGTGTRRTTTASMPKEEINVVAYDEKCPYCHGDGVCRYCEGTGKCWACNGTGRIDSWNFFQKFKKQKKDKG